MNKHVSHSLEETADIAHRWLAEYTRVESVRRQEGTTKNHSASIVGLRGDLGTGKTAFTKAVARELGVEEVVTSPTFVIMKIYPVVAKEASPRFPWKNLVHIDAYRLESSDELRAIKFVEIAADPDSLILIEWPEHVRDVLDQIDGYREIAFEVGTEEGERVIGL